MPVEIKTSLKNVFRSRGKTALFFLLLSALSALLYLGASLYAEGHAQLEGIDESCTTLGVIDYAGDGYPDEWANDASRISALASLDHALISQNSHVLDYMPSKNTLAYAEGYTRRGANASALYQKSAVVIVRSIYYQESHGVYMGVMTDPLYSFRKESNLSIILDTGGYDIPLEREHYYLIHGSFINGPTALPCLIVTPFPHAEDETPWRDITLDPAATLLETDGPFYNAATEYANINGAVSVYALDEPQHFAPMHQELITLKEGRLFTEDEIESGALVCVTTQHVLSGLDLAIGDQLPLSYFRYDMGSYLGEIAQRAYTVVGIMQETSNYLHAVFTPTASIPDDATPFGYTAAQVVIKNGEAAAFGEEVEPLLPDRFTLTIYDQGYQLVSDSVRGLMRTAGYLLIVCAAAALGVAILFGYLFVFRQRAAIGIMQSLGAGRRRTNAYLLCGAVLIAVTAAVAGAIVGRVFSGQIAALVAARISSVDMDALAFSSVSMGAALRFDADANASLTLPLLSAMCVAIASLLSCAVFAGLAVRQADPSRRRRKRTRAYLPKAGAKPLPLPGGAFKFALLSALRGGWRSLVVPIVTLALALLLAALAGSLASYSAERAALAGKTAISGSFTDYGGRRIGGLALNAKLVDVLEESDAIDTVSKSFTEKYLYLGVPKRADGSEQDITTIDIAKYLDSIGGMFQLETMRDNLLREPDLIFTNDLTSVPEFYYVGGMQPTFAQGYDVSIFTDQTPDESQAPVCLASEEFLLENGVDVGDVVRVAVGENFSSVDLVVIGSFPRCGMKNHLYIPCGFSSTITNLLKTAVFESRAGLLVQLRPINDSTYTSASFTLKSAAHLDDLRSWLVENGYGSVGKVGKNRATVLIRDAEFIHNRDRLTRQIEYLSLLLPALFILTAALGFVVAYLMMAGRRLELAMMRSLGAHKRVVLFSYFYEYVLLVLPGVLIALIIFLALGTMDFVKALCLAAFTICYLGGCTFAICRLSREKLLLSLSQPE